jgi:hypothetical protein
VEDVCDAASLFMDYKTSARILLADEQAAARPKPPAAGDKKAASAGMEMETS